MLHHSHIGHEGDVLPRTGARFGFDLCGQIRAASMTLSFAECEAIQVRNIETLTGLPDGRVVHTETMIEQGAVAPGSFPRAVTITINGTDCTAALGGPFYNDVAGLDVGPFLVQGFNEVVLETVRPGRIKVGVDLVVER